MFFYDVLSLVQIKDKMVISCLKLKENSFKPLKHVSYSQQKRCKWFRQFEKMHSEKTVKQKRKLF